MPRESTPPPEGVTTRSTVGKPDETLSADPSPARDDDTESVSLKSPGGSKVQTTGPVAERLRKQGWS